MLNISSSFAGFGSSHKYIAIAYSGRNSVIAEFAYDSDAAAYFSRVEAIGDSIDTGTKLSINTFVRGCKDDGIWDLMLDVNVLCGSSLSGAMVKLKTFNPSNPNFRPHPNCTLSFAQSSGLIFGTGYGINAGVTPASIGTNSFSLGIYANTNQSSLSIFGTIGADNNSRTVVYCPHPDTIIYSNLHQAPTNEIWGAGISGPVGFIHTNRTPDPTHRIYRNGSLYASSTSVGGTAPSDDFNWEGIRRNNVLEVGTSAGHRTSFFFLGSGMSPTQAGQLYTRVQALQTALGRNV